MQKEIGVVAAILMLASPFVFWAAEPAKVSKRILSGRIVAAPNQSKGGILWVLLDDGRKIRATNPLGIIPQAGKEIRVHEIKRIYTDRRHYVIRSPQD